MNKMKFDFESEIKQLVLRLNSVVSSIEDTPNIEGLASSINNASVTTGDVVSCQIVNFNSESKNYNEYQVYNYCDNVSQYEIGLADYFSVKESGSYINKSVLSIFREKNDDGIWYSQREKELNHVNILLDYNKPAPTTAVYEDYNNEKECRKQWDNWSNLMYRIYPDKAISVFCKKIEIPISSSTTLFSGVFITFCCKLSYSQIGLVGRICETILNEIAFIDLVPGLYKDIENQATRAAISQVMARNTSHNIGAHVMNKLIGDLSKLVFTDFKNYKGGLALYDATADNNKIILDQISIFNNYVKCRMDYLADISFGTPLMQTNKYAYADLFKELDKVRLLLEHISGLDGFKFEIEFKKNGEPLSDTNDLLVAIPNDILGTQAFYNILENIIRNSAKHSDKSKLKGQVVFTVNFIDDINGVYDYCKEEYCTDKNCDKVHKKEIENTLNEFIAVEVYDNIPVVGKKKELTEKEQEEYKERTGNERTEFESYIDYLVFNQNKKLNENILHENRLRTYSLGLVEMDASAAYLRKRPVEYINHHSYDIQYDNSWSRNTELNEGKQQIRGTNCRHFLKAFKKTAMRDNSQKTEHYLGYRFFLHRPAVVLVITDLLKDDNERKDKLWKKGVWVIAQNHFENELRNEDKVYPHEFVVYSVEDKNSIESLINDYGTSLPTRILEFNTAELNKLLNLELKVVNILEKGEDECWILWGEKLKSEELYGIAGEVNIKTSMGGLCSATKSEDCNCEKDNQFNAVILDHQFEHYNKYRHCKKVNYLDNLSTKAFEKLPRLNVNLESNEWSFYRVGLLTNHTQKRKLQESTFAQILVIDERVQNQVNAIYYADDTSGVKILNHEIYNRSGIIIPLVPENTSFVEDNLEPSNSKFNLSANDFNKSFGTGLQKYIKYYATRFKKTDFILIHFSILERVYGNAPDKAIKINGFLNEIAAGNSPQIVITSGRGGGALTELTNKVRFANLSSVITAFVEIRSKYYCNYLLNSSRKNKK